MSVISRYTLSDAVIERIVRVYDREVAAAVGEPSPWECIDNGDSEALIGAEEWRRERIAIMRLALAEVILE